VEFYLNGLDYGPGVSEVSNLWSLNFALLPRTNFIWTLATDMSGNISSTNVLSVTYVNRQTNANLITLSEHWLDSSHTNNAGDVFDVSQDTGILNAALRVPGLESLSASAWSNLALAISFGDVAFSNRLAAADVLTSNNAVFYLNTIFDPNDNLLTDVQLAIARSGSTLVIAYETSDPTYDVNNPIIADFYLRQRGFIHDQQPFALTLQDGSTFTSYANVHQTVYISGSNTLTYDLQSNQLDNVEITGAADFIPPTNTITAPINGQHSSNAVFTVTGAALDNIQVSNVWFQVNGTGWQLASTENGWTNWTATVTLTIGTNILSAYAVDASGNCSATNSVSLVSSTTFKLQLGLTNHLFVKTNGFCFNLELSSGLNGHIQVSTNLTSWATLTNFAGTNATITFRDPATTNFSHRYYRAVIP
jgi:hypothetical protein